MIKAIETHYAGCRFRSRLEARWAVFFDALGVTWNYEPEGFELTPLPADHWRRGPLDYDDNADKHLGYYLPDFHLADLDIWFEVKGQRPDDKTSNRLLRFSDLANPAKLVTAIGGIPDPQTFDYIGHPYDDPSFDIWLDGGSDYHYAWCICTCGKLGVEFDARGGRICGHTADDKQYSGNHPRILAAYKAARSARFEHGERG